MVKKIEIGTEKKEKRVANRNISMPIGDQLEAIIEMANLLDSQGVDIGHKMKRIVDIDKTIRESIK